MLFMKDLFWPLVGTPIGCYLAFMYFYFTSDYFRQHQFQAGSVSVWRLGESLKVALTRAKLPPPLTFCGGKLQLLLNELLSRLFAGPSLVEGETSSEKLRGCVTRFLKLPLLFFLH